MKDDLTKKLIAGIAIGISIPVAIIGIAEWLNDVNEAKKYYYRKKWNLD